MSERLPDSVRTALAESRRAHRATALPVVGPIAGTPLAQLGPRMTGESHWDTETVRRHGTAQVVEQTSFETVELVHGDPDAPAGPLLRIEVSDLPEDRLAELAEVGADLGRSPVTGAHGAGSVGEVLPAVSVLGVSLRTEGRRRGTLAVVRGRMPAHPGIWLTVLVRELSGPIELAPLADLDAYLDGYEAYVTARILDPPSPRSG